MAGNTELTKIYFDEKEKKQTASVQDIVIFLDSQATPIQTMKGPMKPVRGIEMGKLPFQPVPGSQFPTTITTVAAALEFLMERSGREKTEIFPMAMLEYSGGTSAGNPIPLSDRSLYYTVLSADGKISIDNLSTEISDDAIYSARVTVSAFIKTASAAETTITVRNNLSDEGPDFFRIPPVKTGPDTTTAVSTDVLFVNITKGHDLGVWIVSDKNLTDSKFQVSVTYLPQKYIIDVLPQATLMTIIDGEAYPLWSTDPEGWLTVQQ